MTEAYRKGDQSYEGGLSGCLLHVPRNNFPNVLASKCYAVIIIIGTVRHTSWHSPLRPERLLSGAVV
jgi:hypothetical protein